VVKQVIDELKKGFAVTSICNRNFLAKDALFLTGVITFNLLICINRIALHRKLQTAIIKRNGLLLHLPANVVRRSRKLWVKIDRHVTLCVLQSHGGAGVKLKS